jgi:hypothetical protein
MKLIATSIAVALGIVCLIAFSRGGTTQPQDSVVLKDDGKIQAPAEPAPNIVIAPKPDENPKHVEVEKLAVQSNQRDWSKEPVGEVVEKGTQWLVSVQGADGGWGQDGGETSFVRSGERLESQGNDVANTAVSTLALMRAGHTPTKGKYKENVNRAIGFVLGRIEESSAEGLELKTPSDTQIQRKLGRYIDTFMASMLLAEVDGNMGDVKADARVRQALKKVIAKIEKNQGKDGSWNSPDAWAPILSTSYCSRSLDVAQRKGVAVNKETLDKVQNWTIQNATSSFATGAIAAEEPALAEKVAAAKPATVPADAARISKALKETDPKAKAEYFARRETTGSAGVKLYEYGQTVEQLSRTPEDIKANELTIKAMTKELGKDETIRGFGSMGGEEFFSYLNTSDSLRRVGGEPWDKWNAKIKAHINGLQNKDGTWAGQHCITGRVACTGAAMLTVLAERAPSTTAKSEVSTK